MKPEEHAELIAAAQKQMDGATILGKALGDLARLRMDQTKGIVNDVLMPFVEKALRAQGIELSDIRQTHHEDGSASIKANSTSTLSVNGLAFEQSGPINIAVGQDQSLTYDIHFTRSKLSVSHDAFFKVGSGAQTDLLRLFFADTKTLKKKRYEIGDICEILDKGFYGAAKSYKTKVRKRYLDARCDLNAIIKANSTISEDFLLYEDKALFINKTILKM